MELEKIFVVEDDLIIQLFITKTLEWAGYSVVGEARSGKETLELLEGVKPDLILMDISFVGNMDGIETAHEINNRYNIPLIFMTGNADEATIERARQADPLGFIFKPIDENHLINKLRELKTE